jgi:dihydrofolate reductase
MRQLRYSVAASLDGFIAGPNGEFDWIPNDPDFDFRALYARFSAMVMGRKTYEVTLSMGEAGRQASAMPTYVYSRTLPEGEQQNGLAIVRDGVAHTRKLKAEDGKPVWLFGGGELFATLAREGLVDGVEVAVMPVILGRGLPLAPLPDGRLWLELRSHRVYPKTGALWLEYDVKRG